MKKTFSHPRGRPRETPKKSQPLNDVNKMDSYLGYWFRLASNHITAAFKQRLAEKDISVAEWLALRFLYSDSPCSLTRLAEEMGMDKGAVSRLADRLEKRGLIKRTVSVEDRRLFSIALTDEGVELVPKLAVIADQNDIHFFGYLPKKEQESIFQFLKEFVNHHGIKTKPLD